MTLQNHSDVFLKSIIDDYSDMVYRLCLVYLKNRSDAEDAYQDIFVKIINSSFTFNSENHKKAWIIRVSSNHCKNLLKKSNHYQAVSLDENFILSSESSNDEEILQTIFKLPLNYRNVIYLYYYEGYSTKEISMLLRKREATIRTWLKRAREKLKIMLGGVFDE